MQQTPSQQSSILDNGQEEVTVGGQWNPYPLGRRDVPPDTVAKKVSKPPAQLGTRAAPDSFIPVNPWKEKEEKRLMRIGLGDAYLSAEVERNDGYEARVVFSCLGLDFFMKMLVLKGCEMSSVGLAGVFLPLVLTSLHSKCVSCP